MTTRAVLGVWTLALVVAAGAVVLVLGSNHTDDKVPTLLFAVPAALAFVASGILAKAQRPTNATGTLLILVGFAWALGALTAANNDYLFTAGLLLGTVFSAGLGHLFLAFPTGRLSSAVDRRIVAAFYGFAFVGPLLISLFDEGEISTSNCTGPCPDNLISLFPQQPVANVIAVVYALGVLALVLLVLARMIRRWRRASPALRRSLGPVLAAAVLVIAAVLVQNVISVFSEDLAHAINVVTLAAVLVVPLSFLYGLLRPRFGMATRRLVAELSEKRSPIQVQAVLRRVLRDQDLRLGYRMPGQAGYLGVDGRPLDLPEPGAGRAATTVGDEVIVHDAALLDQPELEETLAAVHIALERGIMLSSLESSERRASALLESIPDSMYRLDADGTFLEFRLSETARLPIDADDLVGMNVADVLSPEATADVFAAMRRAREHGTVEVVNYTLEYGDEPLRYLEARVVASEGDESVATVRDVTDRTLQQQALESLAEGRAALTRVALAVATAETPESVFGVVTEEVGRLFRADAANLVRYDRLKENEGVVVGRWSQLDRVITPVGTRIELLGGAVTEVRRTGRPARARVPEISEREADLLERLQELGITSLVAAPIEVSGELWGSVVVWLAGEDEFPDDVEERLEQFGKLVAVALANAEAREDLAQLAAEQAALSRVAVSVATEKPDRLFGVVTEEVALRLGADGANLIRFEPSDELEGVVVGTWSNYETEIAAAGTRVRTTGGPVTRVRRTAQPARGHIDDPDIVPSPLVDRFRAQGVRSIIAAPIVVSGELWGAVMLSTNSERTFAADAEARIEQFTSLVAVALANAEANERVSALAEEQAALSRVAVAVATEREPENLFSMVSREIGLLFGAQAAETVRYVPDADEAVVVGGWRRDRDLDVRLGGRLPFKGGAITRVARTGRPARIDIEDESDEIRELMVADGVTSGVAAPIIVSGRLWGATSISILTSERFPPDAEERLEKFTRLVAVALANAQAREELAGLAEEQAALTRVALSAATEERPERLFSAVSEEVGRLLGARSAATVRYVDGADESVLVGGWGREERYAVDVGARVPFQGGAIERVKRTGKPARVDVDTVSPEVQRTMASTEVSSQVAAPIVVSGRLWGATSVSLGPTDTFPPDAEERLGKFTHVVAVALANAQAREELTASRARIVQAGDAARRRLERNLHDGAQQRLVALSLSLRLAQGRLPSDVDGARAQLEAASEELQLALEELRELARGIHPAILTDRGLNAALEALALRTSIPVALKDVCEERLPPPVEAAAYYVVAESLTNVAKYAEASSASVSVTRNDGRAVVEVEDDGVGGADASKGSGLRGLADRVAALDGRLVVTSAPGGGTRVRAEIPL